MNRNENNTLDDILSAAKAEFSEKGFHRRNRHSKWASFPARE